jgi:hypothetical protein
MEPRLVGAGLEAGNIPGSVRVQGAGVKIAASPATVGPGGKRALSAGAGGRERLQRAKVYRRGRGSVVIADDFADIGKRATIDLALSRLTRAGTLQRIARGIYSYVRVDPVLGITRPTVEAIVRAVAGAGRMRLQASGAYAANLLGLSEQVPLRVVYLTDGASRNIRVGKTQIVLKRTTPQTCMRLVDMEAWSCKLCGFSARARSMQRCAEGIAKPNP